jgi:hypothetical protein
MRLADRVLTQEVKQSIQLEEVQALILKLTIEGGFGFSLIASSVWMLTS